jgi:hypothetical protein
VSAPFAELERIARRVPMVGLGSNFTDYISNSDFAGKWNDVQAQLTAEGYGPDSLAAKAIANKFADIFDSLSSQPGVEVSTALEASKQFIIAGETTAGAVHTIQQIQQAAAGGDPAAAFNIVAGALVAAATTGGLVSAGAGALITLGVAVTLDMMSKIGLFGSPPQGQEWCSGLRSTATPVIQVGCVTTFGNKDAMILQNGSPFWRRFPKRSGGNTNDAGWFNATGSNNPLGQGGFNNIQWSGSLNGPKAWWTSYGNQRLIDSAFADFHYLACQSVPSALQPFAEAFTQAWIANKEYELNGLKSQPDWQVLRTTLSIWNRAHQATSYVDLAPIDKPTVPPVYFAKKQGQQVFDPANPGFTELFGFSGGPTCPSNLPPLLQTLVGQVIGHGSSQDPVFVSLYNAQTNTLRVHTGAPVVVKKVIPLVLGVRASAPTTVLGQLGAQFDALSLPAKVAVVGGGAAAATAAGGSLYAVATGQHVGAFWSGMWQGSMKAGREGVLGALSVVGKVGEIFAAGKKR